MKKLLLIQGGGPTAVFNASLYGAIKQAALVGFDEVYGAKRGFGGLLQEEFYRLDTLSPAALELFLTTPGSVIGTSRDPLEAQEYELARRLLEKHGFTHVLLNGGNGTMDTCRKLHEMTETSGIRVMGMPKTMDNDLAGIDHSPGYASAAYYLAQSAKELAADLQGLSIHTLVMEVSGRNAGWLAAATAAAFDQDGLGPDLILTPERSFDEDAFFAKVEEIYAAKRSCLVVCSEGLTDKNKQPVSGLIYESGRSKYFGDVSSHLANLLIRKLGIKARGEKPGLLGRCSIALRSELDLAEAVKVGEVAVSALSEGVSGKMVGIERLKGATYQVAYPLLDLRNFRLEERVLPAEYIEDMQIASSFKDWLLPLFDKPLTPMYKLPR